MQSRMPDTTRMLPEAMSALLEQAKPYLSRPSESRIACAGHKRTKEQQPTPEGACMSVSGRIRARTGMLVTAGYLLGATPASAAGGIGIGSGRLVPSAAAVVGLIGVVVGGLALARSRRARTSGRFTFRMRSGSSTTPRAS